jgi:hypothetical protein
MQSKNSTSSNYSNSISPKLVVSFLVLSMGMGSFGGQIATTAQNIVSSLKTMTINGYGCGGYGQSEPKYNDFCTNTLSSSSSSVSVLSSSSSSLFAFSSSSISSFSSSSTTSTQSSTTPTSPKIAAKVFLSANFDDTSDTMTNDLRGNNILSTTQPYNASPYNYGGTESLPTTNLRTDLVDWVLLEVKDSTTGLTIAKKPGVLTKDGNIIDPTNAVTGNTTLGVAVPVSTNGNYKVIIRHRNHISIATNTAISLSQNTTTTLDLTTNQNVKGSNQKQIGTIGSTPVYGLRLGDINSDGSVDALDRSIIRSAQETTNTYIVQDINLDGSIDSLDRNILRLADETVEDL